MTRFSGEALKAHRASGEARSDLARVRAKTEAELEADIAGDPAFLGQDADWYEAARAVMPAPKQALSLRLDVAVVEWFRQQGPGYQTRINAVLRAFVAQQTGRGGWGAAGMIQRSPAFSAWIAFGRRLRP